MTSPAAAEAAAAAEAEAEEEVSEVVTEEEAERIAGARTAPRLRELLPLNTGLIGRDALETTSSSSTPFPILLVVVAVMVFVVGLEEVDTGIEDRDTVGRSREEESGRLTGRVVKCSFFGEDGLQMAMTGEMTGCSDSCFASFAFFSAAIL